MEATPDARHAVKTFTSAQLPALSASAISETFRTAVQDDEEVRQAHAACEEMRRTICQQVIETLGSQTHLRDGLTIDTATDLLMNLSSDANYQFLITTCGPDHDQVVDHPVRGRCHFLEFNSLVTGLPR